MGANTYLNDEERDIRENAVVGIAGAGGLGSNCAMHLVRAGMKRLVIADFDVVSESNLNRQFFFRDQLGRKKVDALAENLRRIEPDLKLDLRDVRLDRLVRLRGLARLGGTLLVALVQSGDEGDRLVVQFGGQGGIVRDGGQKFAGGHKGLLSTLHYAVGAYWRSVSLGTPLL